MPYVADTSDLYPDDPQWTGIGQYGSWVPIYKPYRLSWQQGAVTTDPAILDAVPTSAEYYPGEVVATGGDGRPILAGWTKVIWNFDYPLNAAQMNQFFYARDQAVGGPAQPLLYFHTRIDNVANFLDLASGFQDNQYVYNYFKGFMLPIEYKTRARFRFEQVRITFTHVVPL